MGFENTNAHDQIQKRLFASRRASRFFFRKRSSCLLLIHPKPIML
jgi:hypothetical protein